jgi:hypothetical protein
MISYNLERTLTIVQTFGTFRKVKSNNDDLRSIQQHLFTYAPTIRLYVTPDDFQDFPFQFKGFNRLCYLIHWASKS